MQTHLPIAVRPPYTEQGDRGGIPLILLHGLTDSHRSYEPVLLQLPNSIRAFALTQRGHGDAPKPPHGYGPSDFARDVEAFMDARGIERAVIVGHSMGAAAAERFAAEYPERTLGLVLAGCFATFHRPELYGLLEEFRSLGDPVDPAYIRAFQESTLANPVPPAFLATVIEESAKVPARVWEAAMAGLIEEPANGRGTIAAPTLLAWGDRDGFVPREDQDALAAAIPHARPLVYERAGHALHWEQPGRFAADVAAFAHRVAEQERAAA